VDGKAVEDRLGTVGMARPGWRGSQGRIGKARPVKAGHGSRGRDGTAGRG